MVWSEVANALAARRGTHVHNTDDTDGALDLVYVGEEASATVEVDSSGDITFKHGDAGSEAVDTTVVASTGKIDVSAAAGDTFGEVVDVINASPNWRARLTGVRRAQSSNDTLVIVSETTLTPFTESLTLPIDTSVAFWSAMYIGRIDLDATPPVNDDLSTLAKIYSISATSTYAGTGSGSTIYIYGVKTDKYGVRTETLLYTVAGAATTVAKEVSWTGGLKDATADFNHGLLVQVINTVAMSAHNLSVEYALCNALEC